MAERSPRDPRDPLDEEAAWAEIVAGYGDRPEFPADGRPERPASDGADQAERSEKQAPDADAPEAAAGAPEARPAGGVPGDGSPSRPGSFVVFAPGVGPRDWAPSEPSDDDFDETDEGHFTPPEPPPLPRADTTTKFAWIAALGGPLLLIAMVVFQQPLTWWMVVLGIGGFLGGLATLFARMGDDREDDDDLPGSGAVV
ncbi:hypothetical protein ADL22_20585 [Streptomyces sp. NRRL F-4489]|uniref:hypothetical protein n=1 Tax=Streptomyces sp. NRRL F-4489 TaxID=1609095 RepID=UPI000749DC43|nr:hypothetical protein [Streptomyces sp. NRRL F-4489]KUL37785.1 hypothetical protein ADL22_20585 [Streptomyces sp. NRRL F-4489]